MQTKWANAERDTYVELYAAKGEEYAGEQTQHPGRKFLPIFLEHTGDQRGTVLDAGCGAGTGSLALQEAGFDVIACDLTSDGRIPAAQKIPFAEACLWHPLRPSIRRGMVDWVYCTDVLEHLPTPMVGLALDQMLRVAARGVFLSVALLPDVFGVWVGKPLHQTVQGFVWWRDLCRELATVTDARDLQQQAVFYLEPR